MGISDVIQYWSNVFALVPGVVVLLLGVLLVAVVGIWIYSARRRDLSMHLHALAEAMDEQARLMEKMRRTLTDIMEVLVSLESEQRYRGRGEQSPGAASDRGTPSLSVTALREELESLKAEISSDVYVGPSAD